MRDLVTITRLITAYPQHWRRWCSGPENGGCACRGCVRVSPSSGCFERFPNPDDRLTEEEVRAYFDAAAAPSRRIDVPTINRLLSKYPPNYRQRCWISSVPEAERGGLACACSGCIHGLLTNEELEAYEASCERARLLGVIASRVKG